VRAKREIHAGACLQLVGLWAGTVCVHCSETNAGERARARGPETALQPARSTEMESCALAQRTLCTSADLNTQN
jgi:hypothetical protein